MRKDKSGVACLFLHIVKTKRADQIAELFNRYIIIIRTSTMCYGDNPSIIKKENRDISITIYDKVSG